MIIILRAHTRSGKSTLMKALVSELNFQSIEVDALKKTDSNQPYKLAAKKLGKYKKEGLKNIVIEGAFNPQNRIDEFFNEANSHINPKKLLIIRLQCSLKTAISRKLNLTEDIVSGQVNKEWVSINGEHLICTENKSKSEVLKEAKEIIASKEL